ncbi:hypothetical protein N0V90_007142 [Kalmusia sp. IMI 367209]|nr:hypothetical protein N0V90_007142 [Kalmusia sp. IMI 367209]
MQLAKSSEEHYWTSLLIQSPQFTFFIGDEGKPVVVHAAAIAAASEQLNALINSGMVESKTRCAKIEDVQVDDFIRFCEYAYRGDYTVPPWEEILPEPSSISSKALQNGEDDDWGPTPKKKKKGKKIRETSSSWAFAFPPPAGEEPPHPEPYDEPISEVPAPYDEPIVEVPEPQYEKVSLSRIQLRTSFNCRNHLKGDSPKSVILRHFEPVFNKAVNQNFAPVLLAHARLYCFAHLRLIEPLKALTLDKLHKTLMNFKLYTKRVGDIIELARYVYSNQDLPDRKDDGTLNDLKKLVIEYIVCEIDTIGKHDEFVKYMEEGGEFVGDFWKLARDYMT